jgi:hypothetical protein
VASRSGPSFPGTESASERTTRNEAPDTWSIQDFAKLDPPLRIGLSIAGFAAPIAYAVCYFGIAAYYEPLGLTPADAGVTQTGLLARAAGVVFALGGLLALGGLYVVAVRRLLRWVDEVAARPRRRRRFITYPLGIAVFVASPY